MRQFREKLYKKLNRYGEPIPLQSGPYCGKVIVGGN